MKVSSRSQWCSLRQQHCLPTFGCEQFFACPASSQCAQCSQLVDLSSERNTSNANQARAIGALDTSNPTRTQPPTKPYPAQSQAQPYPTEESATERAGCMGDTWNHTRELKYPVALRVRHCDGRRAQLEEALSGADASQEDRLRHVCEASEWEPGGQRRHIALCKRTAFSGNASLLCAGKFRSPRDIAKFEFAYFHFQFLLSLDCLVLVFYVYFHSRSSGNN